MKHKTYELIDLLALVVFWTGQKTNHTLIRGIDLHHLKMSSLTLRINFRLKIFLILFHAFKHIIMLLEEVYQVRQDFVGGGGVGRNGGGRGTSSVRGGRSVNVRCGRTSVDRSVDDSIVVISF